MKRLPLTTSIVLLLCFYANAQSRVDAGFHQEGRYINPALRFSYKYPKDWVVHGEETNKRIREIGKEKITESGAVSKPAAEVALNNTSTLLTIFRHPIGTPGITINPGILVIAEKVAHAPGIITGKDYLLNVRAIQLEGRNEVLLKDPMEYRFGGSQFFRDDYAVGGNNMRLVQAFFAKIVDGYALVFIFTGEDQKSVDEMAKTMETFAVTPPVRRGVKTVLGPDAQPTPKP